MRTFPDVRFRDLLGRLGAARRALDSGENAEALELLQKLAGMAGRLGVDSGFVASSRATALERLGRLEEAFQAACEAANSDPLSGPYQDQFAQVSWRLRLEFGDPDRDAHDPSTPRLYDLLMAAGEADVSCHVTMARFHAAGGRLEEAERLLEAVTRLAPTSRDAWRARAAVARQAGNESLVLACEAAVGEEGVRRTTPFALGPVEAAVA